MTDTDDEHVRLRLALLEEAATLREHLRRQHEAARKQYSELRDALAVAGENMNRLEGELAGVDAEIEGVIAGLQRHGHAELVEQLRGKYQLENPSAPEPDLRAKLHEWTATMPEALRGARVEVNVKGPDGNYTRRILRPDDPRQLELTSASKGAWRKAERRSSRVVETVRAPRPVVTQSRGDDTTHEDESVRESWVDKTRKDAVLDILRDFAPRPVGPTEIAEALQRVGRDDEPRLVSAVLAYLKRQGLAHAPRHGEWVLGPDEESEE